MVVDEEAAAVVWPDVDGEDGEDDGIDVVVDAAGLVAELEPGAAEPVVWPAMQDDAGATDGVFSVADLLGDAATAAQAPSADDEEATAQSRRESSRDEAGWEADLALLESVDDVATQRLARQMRREKRRERRNAAKQNGDTPTAETAAAALRTAAAHEQSGKTSFAENAVVNPRTLPGAERGRWGTHKRLRIVSGALGGRRILSPDTPSVRPMMERVRGAAMDMLLAQSAAATGAKSARTFPEGARWLDLYSGTGAVGIEGVSRGCGAAHFVECDADVLKRVLHANIRSLDLPRVGEEHGGSPGDVRVHPTTVESFLSQHEASRGAPFDFVSVTPPYQLVEYAVLLPLLAKSGVLCAAASTVLVEFPLEESRAIPAALQVTPPEGAAATEGQLELARERKYGRTVLAVYAPS